MGSLRPHSMKIKEIMKKNNNQKKPKFTKTEEQIKGKIHATKPGHKNNIKFAKYLQNIIKTKNGL